MEELQIKVSSNVGMISANFAEIEANIKAVAADYKGIVVTEDTVKESKKDVAQLRKIIKEIEDSRKSVKKKWNEPYVQFEGKCKQLEALIQKPLEEIGSQIAVFEQKRIDEKKEHLASLYSENIEGYSEYITFEVTLGDKWQNVSFTDKDYLYDLSEMKVKIKSDLAAISSLHSEIEQDVISSYKNSGNNLSVAIQKNSDYLSAKEKAEQRVREEAERKAEIEKQKEVVQPSVEKPVVKESVVEEPTFTFRVTGIEQITLVKKYLDFAEIKYEEV